MNNKETFLSITYILSGSLLLVFNDITENWMGKLLVLIGYIFYFKGLNKLVLGLDEIGKNGAKNLKTAVILGIIAIIIDFVPIIGGVSIFFYFAAFILQLIGLIKLKKSKSTGKEGIKGINLILIAVVIGIFQGIFDYVPFVGHSIVFLIAILYIIFIISGWINVQRGICYSEFEPSVEAIKTIKETIKPDKKDLFN